MKPAPFEYFDPRTVDEAVALLETHGDDAKVLAGGQSLVPMLALRVARPAAVVDVNRVAGLDGLRQNGTTVSIGALVRQRALERWAAERAPLFIVMGSSLAVAPANLLPKAAVDRGAPLVIVNRDPTPQDGKATLVIHAGIGATLRAADALLAKGPPGGLF